MAYIHRGGMRLSEPVLTSSLKVFDSRLEFLVGFAARFVFGFFLGFVQVFEVAGCGIPERLRNFRRVVLGFQCF